VLGCLARHVTEFTIAARGVFKSLYRKRRKYTVLVFRILLTRTSDTALGLIEYYASCSERYIQSESRECASVTFLAETSTAILDGFRLPTPKDSIFSPQYLSFQYIAAMSWYGKAVAPLSGPFERDLRANRNAMRASS